MFKRWADEINEDLRRTYFSASSSLRTGNEEKSFFLNISSFKVTTKQFSRLQFFFLSVLYNELSLHSGVILFSLSVSLERERSEKANHTRTKKVERVKKYTICSTYENGREKRVCVIHGEKFVFLVALSFSRAPRLVPTTSKGSIKIGLINYRARKGRGVGKQPTCVSQSESTELT